jgi:hypothetical protein
LLLRLGFSLQAQLAKRQISFTISSGKTVCALERLRGINKEINIINQTNRRHLCATLILWIGTFCERAGSFGLVYRSIDIHLKLEMEMISYRSGRGRNLKPPCKSCKASLRYTVSNFCHLSSVFSEPCSHCQDDWYNQECDVAQGECGHSLHQHCAKRLQSAEVWNRGFLLFMYSSRFYFFSFICISHFELTLSVPTAQKHGRSCPLRRWRICRDSSWNELIASITTWSV